jgi:hypothetical protein
MDSLFKPLAKRRVLGWKETSRGEVFEVVINLNGDKAPGPDGFFWIFFSNMLGDFERGYNGSFYIIS